MAFNVAHSLDESTGNEESTEILSSDFTEPYQSEMESYGTFEVSTRICTKEGLVNSQPFESDVNPKSQLFHECNNTIETDDAYRDARPLLQFQFSKDSCPISVDLRKSPDNRDSSLESLQSCVKSSCQTDSCVGGSPAGELANGNGHYGKICSLERDVLSDRQRGERLSPSHSGKLPQIESGHNQIELQDQSDQIRTGSEIDGLTLNSIKEEVGTSLCRSGGEEALPNQCAPTSCNKTGDDTQTLSKHFVTTNSFKVGDNSGEVQNDCTTLPCYKVDEETGRFPKHLAHQTCHKECGDIEISSHPGNLSIEAPHQGKSSEAPEHGRYSIDLAEAETSSIKYSAPRKFSTEQLEPGKFSVETSASKKSSTRQLESGKFSNKHSGASKKSNKFSIEVATKGKFCEAVVEVACLSDTCTTTCHSPASCHKTPLVEGERRSNMAYREHSLEARADSPLSVSISLLSKDSSYDGNEFIDKHQYHGEEVTDNFLHEESGSSGSNESVSSVDSGSEIAETSLSHPVEASVSNVCEMDVMTTAKDKSGPGMAESSFMESKTGFVAIPEADFSKCQEGQSSFIESKQSFLPIPQKDFPDCQENEYSFTLEKSPEKDNRRLEIHSSRRSPSEESPALITAASLTGGNPEGGSDPSCSSESTAGKQIQQRERGNYRNQIPPVEKKLNTSQDYFSIEVCDSRTSQCQMNGKHDTRCRSCGQSVPNGICASSMQRGISARSTPSDSMQCPYKLAKPPSKKKVKELNNKYFDKNGNSGISSISHSHLLPEVIVQSNRITRMDYSVSLDLNHTEAPEELRIIPNGTTHTQVRISLSVCCQRI